MHIWWASDLVPTFRDLSLTAEKLMAIGCFCIGTNQVDLETTKSRGIPTQRSPLKYPQCRRAVITVVMLLPALVTRAVPRMRQMVKDTREQ